MTETPYRQPINFSKTGLVLSGGVTKAAAFHVGVCLALRDQGFTFIGGKNEEGIQDACPYPPPRIHPYQIATYVGSSAGALIAGFLGAGVGVESLINSFAEDTHFRVPGEFHSIPRIQYRDVLAPNWKSIPSALKSFGKSAFASKTIESKILRSLRLPGFFSTRGLAKYLQKHVLTTEKFYELKSDLFVVGTQLDHSRKIVFGRYATEKTSDDYCQYASNAPISDAVAASMSLPPIFTPYLIQHQGGKERYYIDGEIRETLSTHVAKENGCDLIICSYTHQPYHYSEETGSLNQYGIPAIVIQSIYQAIEQKIYGSKRAHENKIVALKIVREFFEKKKYPNEDLQELMAILQKELDFKQSLNYIFIHPEENDHEMFFGDHFTLSPKIMQNVVTIGYKRAKAELRKYELIPQTS